jgi:hypothetical protein
VKNSIEHDVKRQADFARRKRAEKITSEALEYWIIWNNK